MKARFYLSSKLNSEGRATILLFLSTHNKRVTVSTGNVIKPQNWNYNSQKARGSSIDASNLNNKLINFGTKAINLLTKLVETNYPNISQEFKKRLKENTLTVYKHIQNAISGSSGTFIEFIEKYITTCSKSKTTLKEYSGILKILKNFQSTYFKQQLSFEVIDFEFYDLFIKFCEKQDYSLNTIGRHIKSIKTLMGIAEANELHVNSKYRNKRFKKPLEESFSIHLSEDEISTLYNFQIINNLTFERVRDLFVAACWLGVRISDLFAITENHIFENKISFRVKKTGEHLDLPIHPAVREIIKKYKGSLPPKISEQKFNQIIKEVARLAGFDSQISYSITKGGKLIETVLPKYELISAHTARRSFATNMYVRGIPVQIIMSVTGHSTERSFRTYIKSNRFDAVKNLNEIFNFQN